MTLTSFWKSAGVLLALHDPSLSSSHGADRFGSNGSWVGGLLLCRNVLEHMASP
jgi:hypothetical protein